MWVRLDRPCGPLFVGVGYFPASTDVQGHIAANRELAASLAKFSLLGSCIFGGDLNAHLRCNGDVLPVDQAGLLLRDTLAAARMSLVNALPAKCVGGPSRREVRRDGTQTSTVDYVAVSNRLASKVKKLEFAEDQMASDHKPLVLTMSDLNLHHPPNPPSPPGLALAGCSRASGSPLVSGH